jgi:sugar transferase (PEP-CTERM/EpsH1 system associated)
MTAPSALYLAHRIPYPPNKGDKIRSWRTLQHLAARFRVHLCAFVDDAADFQHEDHLRGVCESVALVPLDRRVATLKSAVGLVSGEPLTMPYYRDVRMKAAVVAARAQTPAVEIAFSSSMAQYLARKAAAPRIVDLCDADSAKWTEYGRRKGWPMSAVYAREGRLLAKAETSIINWAEAAFAVSEEEADLLGNRDGAAKEVSWFGNGVDVDFFKPAATSAERFDVVFVGAMDYWANVDAVCWFVREIWPIIRGERERATFAIVGSNPARDLVALDGRDGVKVTGRVDDVRPYVAGAGVVVAPMRIARGVQNKVLEAMAMGKAVVTTPAGLEGIDATMGEEAVAVAAPESFAREVLRLLGDRSAAEKIGGAARSRIVADYQWPAQLSRLDAAIERLIAAAPA